jgi:hypothetical protein
MKNNTLKERKTKLFGTSKFNMIVTLSLLFHSFFLVYMSNPLDNLFENMCP